MAAWSTGYNWSNWADIVTDGAFIYSSNNTTIGKTNIATGVIDTLEWATGFNALSYLQADATHLYAMDINPVSSDPNGIIYKIPFADPSIHDIFSTDVSSPVGSIILDGFMYVASSGSNYISKLSLTNPADNVIYWVQNELINNPVGIAVHGTTMYVTTTGSTYAGWTNTIFTININTATLNTTPIAIFSDPVYDLVIYENKIYVACYNTNSIIQMDLSGNIINSSWATVPGVDGLLIIGTDIYCCAYDLESIYKLSLNMVCFKEGTSILTNNGYKAIQDLRNGDLVKTWKHGDKPIVMIGKKDIYHVGSSERIPHQLYVCSSSAYSNMTEDLILTGAHAILVDRFNNSEQREAVRAFYNGNIYLTDEKARLPAFIDKRSAVYDKPGTYTIYHFALENDNYYTNYGVYANGLLVETSSKRYLKELSDMTLIE
jgi:hypothetical protein